MAFPLAERSQIWDTSPVKVARFHPAARDALRTFPMDVRRAFGKAIYDLQLGHVLSMPISRAIPDVGSGVAEIRIQDTAGAYRAFYVTRIADAIVVFHAFMKKTRKTPEREIQLGKKRLKEML
jgi:phage-related protein